MVVGRRLSQTLLLDPDSQSDTYPTMEVGNSSADLEHEASVSKVSNDQLFYLMLEDIVRKKRWA